jgi:hypothetical protein
MKKIEVAWFLAIAALLVSLPAGFADCSKIIERDSDVIQLLLDLEAVSKHGQGDEHGATGPLTWTYVSYDTYYFTAYKHGEGYLSPVGPCIVGK